MVGGGLYGEILEMADSYMLLATELDGDTGRGGSVAKDCDMNIVVSSSISDESERDEGEGGLGEKLWGSAVADNDTMGESRETTD